MADRFWWASPFEGPKGGYPPKKVQFFLVKSLVNGLTGKETQFQPLWPGRLAVIKAQKKCGSIWPPPPMAERVKTIIEGSHLRFSMIVEGSCLWYLSKIRYLIFIYCFWYIIHIRRFPKPQHFFAEEWQKWYLLSSRKTAIWTLIDITFVSFKNMGLVHIGFEVSKSQKLFWRVSGPSQFEGKLHIARIQRLFSKFI